MEHSYIISFAQILPQISTVPEAAQKLATFLYHRLKTIEEKEGSELLFSLDEEKQMIRYAMKFALTEENRELLFNRMKLELAVDKCYRIQYPQVNKKIVLNDSTPDDIISQIQTILYFLSQFGRDKYLYPFTISDNSINKKLENCKYMMSLADENNILVYISFKDNVGNFHKINVYLFKSASINFKYSYFDAKQNYYVERSGNIFSPGDPQSLVDHYCGKK